MKNKNPILQEWIDLADSDLAFAQTGFEAEDFYHLICFHCQQSVEKIIKAFLIYHRTKFPKIHDLIELNKLCLLIDPSFTELREEISFLNTFYVETRYAGGFFKAIDKKDAEKAINLATEIMRFTKAKMK